MKKGTVLSTNTVPFLFFREDYSLEKEETTMVLMIDRFKLYLLENEKSAATVANNECYVV